MAEIEKFTCCLYSMPKLSKVNEVRMAVFEKKFAPSKQGTDPLSKIKGMNPSDMPPCWLTLVNKVKRVNCVAYLWKNAPTRNPSDLDPVEHGWTFKENKYVINWYDGEQLPQSIVSIIGTEGTGIPSDDMDEFPECSSDDEDDNE